MTKLTDLLGRKKRVVSVPPGVTVREAAKAMAEENVGAAVILDGEKLVGLFTERDVLKRVLLQDLDVDAVPVTDVMTREIVCAEDSQNVADARWLMTRHHIRHLPVLNSRGDLVGVLSIRDLVHAQMEELSEYIALHEG